jgi:hypothetical protein
MTQPSVNSMGQIPLLSKFFVKSRIKSAKRGIAKTRDKVERLISAQRQKVDSVVAAAKRTDSATLIHEAQALQEDLEGAACVDVDFKEEGEGHAKGETKKPTKNFRVCAKELGLKAWRSSNTPEQNQQIESCVRASVK